MSLLDRMNQQADAARRAVHGPRLVHGIDIDREREELEREEMERENLIANEHGAERWTTTSITATVNDAVGDGQSLTRESLVAAIEMLRQQQYQSITPPRSREPKTAREQPTTLEIWED